MHPAATRNEFLRLRVQGLSLARIGRRLGVSKPTLIAWNRHSRTEIANRVQADQQCVEQEVSTSSSHELAALNRRLTALKQELFSRAMRDFPTSALEIFAGEIRQRIEELTGACPPPPGAQAPALRSFSEGGSACSNSPLPPEPAAHPSPGTECPCAASPEGTAEKPL
jgi:hypothetical protein